MKENLENRTKKGNSRIPIRNKDLVTCDIKYCELKGQFYKCYFEDHKTCEIYRSENDR